MKNKVILLIGLLFLLNYSYAQTAVVPRPQRLMIKKGSVSLDASAAVRMSHPSLRASADFLNDYLSEKYGFMLSQKGPGSSFRVQLTLTNNKSKIGSYKLDINSRRALIESGNPEGVFYGVQTLIQLLPAERSDRPGLPQVYVEDAPRFAYRGMHLDVSRHFFPVSYIKRYIDYLALHKMNYFHWHLTDDQGWRVEIKKYPRLTEVGAFRAGTITGHFPGDGNTNKTYGGFYTQDEVRELVRYAAKRYITVVPEIEMPGHASAAIAAYPELSCFPEEPTRAPEGTVWAGDTTGKKVQQTWGVFSDVFVPSENTFRFLQDVIDELVTLFPSKYIHIGGDECPKDNWKRSAFCQQLIREKDLKDEHGLQSYFIQRMEKYINGKGRVIVGWDEILEGGLAPNAIVMSWRGENGGIEAARQEHQVIMTPGSHVYFDHSQIKPDDSLTFGGYTSIRKVYSYEPEPEQLNEKQRTYILGAQANLWTEYIDNIRKLEYQAFPRMAALSEVLWSEKSRREWDDFEKRLPRLLKKYQLWGVRPGPVARDL